MSIEKVVPKNRKSKYDLMSRRLTDTSNKLVISLKNICGLKVYSREADFIKRSQKMDK